MIKNFIIPLYFFSCAFFLQAQTETKKNKNFAKEIQFKTNSRVRIFQDREIDTKLTEDYDKSTENQYYRGYRIQIFKGTSAQKNSALSQKYRFNQKFPYISSYIEYNAPTFRVKVGSFRTKLEAARAKYRIAKFFPDCYIVKDKIKFSLDPPPNQP